MEVKGYENYLIYDDGRCWSKKSKKFMKEQDWDSRGNYKCYGFSDHQRKFKRYSVHRLVALHYIPNPDNLPVVDHIDGDKTNNNISNLRWMTILQNANAFKKIQSNNKTGIKNISYNKQNNIWIYQKRYFGKSHYRTFKTKEEAIAYKEQFESHE
tara:strand:+ start:252 stop:716 length:465 start_codon:yes stop_codon:yes gene_type:complete